MISSHAFLSIGSWYWSNKENKTRDYIANLIVLVEIGHRPVGIRNTHSLEFRFQIEKSPSGCTWDFFQTRRIMETIEIFYVNWKKTGSFYTQYSNLNKNMKFFSLQGWDICMRLVKRSWHSRSRGNTKVTDKNVLQRICKGAPTVDKGNFCTVATCINRTWGRWIEIT